MQQYSNVSGKSGVSDFEAGDDFLIVVFESGNTKTYIADEYGQSVIDQMKELANKGEGLNRFLNKL